MVTRRKFHPGISLMQAWFDTLLLNRQALNNSKTKCVEHIYGTVKAMEWLRMKIKGRLFANDMKPSVGFACLFNFMVGQPLTQFALYL